MLATLAVRLALIAGASLRTAGGLVSLVGHTATTTWEHGVPVARSNCSGPVAVLLVALVSATRVRFRAIIPMKVDVRDIHGHWSCLDFDQIWDGPCHTDGREEERLDRQKIFQIVRIVVNCEHSRNVFFRLHG